MVPDGYWIALAAFGAAALTVRLLRGRSLGLGTCRLSALELAAGVVALLALAFHCAAMFFATEVDAIPGLGGPAEAIRELGLASQLAYALPAALLVLVLRKAPARILAILAASLTAVGVTMFWWFGLDVHLAAIAAAIVALDVLVAGYVTVPRAALRHS